MGLWNDEYMGWWISSFEFGAPLIKKILSNCHMPLYYFYLKLWSSCFGNEDYVLRLSSVVIGVFNILSMYQLGKMYKDQKTGLFCALFSALSGFLIYFSQELRLYGLIFLISTWLLYFFIKTVRNLNIYNFWMFLLFNFLLLITHTIGFVFVFFNLLIFSIIILKQKPEIKRQIFAAYTIVTVCFLPLIPFLVSVLTRESLSQNWGIFNISKILFVLIDYLTPVQTNITNSAVNLFSYFKAVGTADSILFIIIPFCIAIYFIQRTLKQKDPLLKTLTVCCLMYFTSLIIAALLGKLVLSTKYSVEIYPLLILLIVNGFTQKPTKLTRNLAVIYFVIVLSFLLFNPRAPQRLPRLEGHKAPAILLKQAKISSNDHVICLYHQFFRYEKYTNLTPKKVIEIDKASIPKYLICPNCKPEDLKFRGKEKLKSAFLFENEEYQNQQFENIYKKIPSGKKIAIVIPTQVAFFSSNDLKRIANNQKEYKNTEILFMAFSYAKIKLINNAFKYCSFDSMYDYGNWIVITFKKN